MAQQSVHRRLQMTRLPTLLGALLIATIIASAQDTPPAPDARDRIDEALDQTVPQVSIEKKPIRDALAELRKQTNLPFEISDATIELLPYGAATRVTITLQSISVRNGLTRIFDGLGLTMHVSGAAVHVEPAPVLRRLGRRMTIAEVELLARLAEKSWADFRGAGAPRVQFEIPPASQPAEALERAIAQIPGTNAMRQLEGATAALGWIWLPREDALVFTQRRDFVKVLLDRPMASNYQRAALDTTLEDIGRRSGVHIAFDPGVLANVAARERAVDLVSQKTSARQMLELICGRTGLRYEVGEEGVRIFADPDATSAQPLGMPTTAPSLAGGAPRVVVILHKPVGPDGLSVDFLIREDELPPEIQRMRQDVLDEVIAELRKILAAKEAVPRP